MNAIDLLKKDHTTVKSLLAKLTDTTERAIKTRSELLEKIRTEVSIHTTLEEELFYPAFNKAGAKDEAKMVAEAKEEHRAVEELVLPDLFKTDPGSINFSGRMKVLKELLEHHIEEEEEEMFKDAAKLMSKDQLLELGKKMEEKQRQLKAAK
ncbi:hemerythrin domain-containing protein [Halopseudomonas sabulinigri]|uniref:Hemerythrin HHE cation binding domain-containing protein n=1 Tax=Halopseudomonas sabulinigri TaxID=472181 RepID=A0A1H1QUT0_9GAMM|nr:hemerythrin domain-containing protein [Halopseudomonas sabulinigri]SDS27137.1 Hemerythrin HHE cation binding domain-containing protein [Halopseudomonas sabulinigri]